MPEAAVDFLTNLGLPGLVILGMGWVIREQDKRIASLQTALDTQKDLRLEDAQKLAGGVNLLTEALEKQSSKLDAYLESRKPR